MTKIAFWARTRVLQKYKKYLWGSKKICQLENNRILIKLRQLMVERNKIIYFHFANGAEYWADETSLISSKVECMGLPQKDAI